MAIRGLDAKTSGAAVRLIIFMVLTFLATSLLVVTIGNLSFGGSREFKAHFTDATGVNTGDDIRVAGVKVGSVEEIEVQQDDDGNATALVTFKITDDETVLDEGTHATIRYRNLLGQRYIALTHDSGSGGALPEGETIPISQTDPALDLSVLFNGFKPLFQALSPDDINKLSYEVVQVFQGEGGTLESLLASTASLTQTLADRDEVIGDLLDNLDHVLDHVADRDDQLTRLIGSFKNLVGGLKEDRRAILSSLDGISELAVETAASPTTSASRSSATSTTCARWRVTSTAAGPRSTARSRSCRSSSTSSGVRRRTARGSTSTCATSRPRCGSATGCSPRSPTRSAERGVISDDAVP